MTDRPGFAPLGNTALPPSVAAAATDPERARIVEVTTDQPGRWWAFGPYVTERAWGTVREDHSADGRAWDSFPHDHACSRAYRWSEDGLAGICDVEQRLCFALAFWNGGDSILKERRFGLTGPEGNHGEDAKESWWFVDATRTASWLRWRYHYPHDAFPYAALVSEGRRRTRADREFELADTGIFALFQEDPAWRDELLFHEYSHGETGEGLGASHQTGWTALVGALIADRAACVHQAQELR